MDELTRHLLAARDGDELALVAFVRASQADVWRFCARLVDPQAADDLTQEVYLQAVGAAERYRGDAPVRPWLLSIARRVCADEIRRRQRRRRLEGPGASAHAAREPATPADTAIEVRELVDRLPVERREAFVLTQLLGLPYRDAATALGVPIGTIRSRVARAREQLVALLQAADDRTAGP